MHGKTTSHENSHIGAGMKRNEQMITGSMDNSLPCVMKVSWWWQQGFHQIRNLRVVKTASVNVTKVMCFKTKLYKYRPLKKKWLTHLVTSAHLSWTEQWTFSTVQAQQGSLQVYMWPKWHIVEARYRAESITITQKNQPHTCLRGPWMSCDWSGRGTCWELTLGHHMRRSRCLWCPMLGLLSPTKDNLRSSEAQNTIG